MFVLSTMLSPRPPIFLFKVSMILPASTVSFRFRKVYITTVDSGSLVSISFFNSRKASMILSAVAPLVLASLVPTCTMTLLGFC